MGRTKHYTSATAVPLVADTPDLIKQSVVTSLVNGTDISNDIVTNITNGIYAKILACSNMAKNYKDTLDLFPETSVSFHTTKAISVRGILEALENETITYISFEENAVDIDYLAYEWLYERYGYDYRFETFETLPDALQDKFNVTLSDTTLDNGTLILTYSYSDTETNLVTEYHELKETTDITGITTENIYYHVVYSIKSDDKLHFWNYDSSTGVYDYLSPTLTQQDNNYFPIIPIIKYGESFSSDDEDTTTYKIANMLMRKLSSSYDDIFTMLEESESYSKIYQAHILVGSRIQDDSQENLKYLFAHFNHWRLNQINEESDFLEFMKNNPIYEREVGNRTIKRYTYTPPRTVINYVNDAYKADVSFYYIKRETVLSNWEHGDDEYARDVTEIEDINIDISTIRFFKKTSDMEYEMITICGLTQINYVKGSHSSEWSSIDMFPTDEDESNPVIFPLHKELLKEVFPLTLDKNKYMYKTLCIHLGFYEKVRLKWYQSGIFQFVLIVIAIVITVWSAGSAAASVGAAYTAAGAGTAGLIAAATLMAQYVAFTVGSKFLLDYIIENYGWQLAILFAIVLSYAASSSKELTTSETIVAATTSVLSTVDSYFKNEISNIADEIEVLSDEWDVWKADYDDDFEATFENLELVSDAYKQYHIDKAIYMRMTPETFLEVVIQTTPYLPELVINSVDMYAENGTSIDSSLLI